MIGPTGWFALDFNTCKLFPTGILTMLNFRAAPSFTFCFHGKIAWVHWKTALLQIEDRVNLFLFEPKGDEMQHFFTDGACSVPTHKCLSLAAWGVLCAKAWRIGGFGSPERSYSDHGWGWTDCIAGGNQMYFRSRPLHLEWLIFERSDGGVHPTTWACAYFGGKLWSLAAIFGCLENAWGQAISFSLGPFARAPFSGWRFLWSLDLHMEQCHRWAGFILESSPWWEFEAESWSTWTQHWSGRVWQLRCFYFLVAAQTNPNGEASSHTHTPSLEHQVIEIALETDEPVPSASISDQLPVNWQMKCRQTPGKAPWIFIESILQWLCATEQLGDWMVRLTDIEWVFLLIGVDGFQFPFQLDGSTNWTMRPLDSLFQRPTLTMLLRPVHSALQQLSLLFPDAIHQLRSSVCTCHFGASCSACLIQCCSRHRRDCNDSPKAVLSGRQRT